MSVVAGTTIEAKGTFKDVNDSLFDPDAVTCYIETPYKVKLDATEQEPSRDTEGIYRAMFQTPVGYEHIYVVFKGVDGYENEFVGRTKVDLSYYS